MTGSYVYRGHRFWVEDQTATGWDKSVDNTRGLSAFGL